MNTNSGELLAEEKVFQIVGCAIEVLKALGHGLVEKPTKTRWQLSLVSETFLSGKQPLFDVLYKGHKVGLFIPDLIAFDAVVVDIKVIDRITDHERGLRLNYLRITNLRVGVILNFKRAKLEWERIVL